MSTCTSNGHRSGIASLTLLLGTAAALCAGLAISAMNSPASAQGKIPEFMSNSGTVGWISAGPFLDPPAGMRGPIRQHPAHPFHGNLDGPGQVTPAIGNHDDPVLKPWAAAHMKATNDEVLSGKMSLPFTAQSRCYPGGVPGQLLYPTEPMYFIQTPKQVWMIWQRDHMVRRIYLTDKHSENVKPSWFGESIGHYENGDTLVIDTIGLQTKNKNSYIDNYRTPHSGKAACRGAHQARRRRQAARSLGQGRGPRHVQRAALHGQALAQGPNNPLLETVCAENNVDHFYQNLTPIPQATKSDF